MYYNNNMATTQVYLKRRKAGRCVQCNRTISPPDGKAQCLECRAASVQKQKLRRQRRISQGLCSRCGCPSTGKMCAPCRIHTNKTIVECRKRNRPNAKAKARADVFAHYGSKCSCPKCNIVDPTMLTIDHIDGRKSWGHSKGVSGSRLYAWLIRHGYPKGFQTLCFNCNVSKYRNGGTCSHLIISEH